MRWFWRFLAVVLCFSCHYVQDYPVRLLHSVAGEKTYIAYGVLNALCHYAVAAAELLIVNVHVISQYTGFNGRGYLCCAGWFSSVAYRAGQYGYRVRIRWI